MIVAVDIGNTRLKCRMFLPDKKGRSVCAQVSPERAWRAVLAMHLDISPDICVTWWIAPTGRFSWQELKAEVLKIRPRDKFKIVTRKQIPLNVDFPHKVGIDRLLAAFAAVKEYGDSPMLIVDAGSAVTVDVVQNRTFCGGAILPGLTALTETYPKISEKLPLVALPDPSLTTRPVYPGKNTKEAIHSGLYWGTVGAIRQFYEMLCSKQKDVRLILTGGDGRYLLPGLDRVIPPRQIEYHEFLVLDGIHLCSE
jgi:type III pantothenate kinase